MSAEQPIDLLSSSDEEENNTQQQQRPIAVPRRQPPAAAAAALPENAGGDQAAAAAAPPVAAAINHSLNANTPTNKGKKRALLTSVAASSTTTNAAFTSAKVPSNMSATTASSSSAATRQVTGGVLASTSNQDTVMKDADAALPQKQPPPPSRHFQHYDSDDYDSDDISMDYSRQATASTTNDTTVKDADFLKHHCWACQVWIEHPTLLEQNKRNNHATCEKEWCCYLLHEHPILSVPTCVVCSEQLEETSAGVDAASSPASSESPNSETQDDATVCCGCGQDGGEVFLCDACPRAFCHACVAQAHGNANVIQDLQSSNEQWKCCACAPPSFLRELQDYTASLQAAEEEAGDDTNKDEGKDQQKLDELLSYLQMVEDKKEDAEAELDKRDKQLEDFSNNNDIDLGNDLSEDEMLEEYASWQDHRVRLAGTIATILDILKSKYGINPHKVYESLQGPQKLSSASAHDVDDEVPAAEPEWKRLADRENKKRERERFKKKARKTDKDNQDRDDDSYNPTDPKYLIDFTSDVEDLGKEQSSGAEDDESDGNESDAFYAGWRGNRYKASQESIDLALEEEDQRFAKRKITPSVRKRQDDAKEMKNWGSSLKKPSKRKQSSTKSKQDRKPSSLPATQKDSKPSSTTAENNETAVKRKAAEANLDLDSSSDDEEMSITSPSRRSMRKKPSSLVLSSNPLISVEEELVKDLKPHQMEGIEFMYRNSFADLGGDTETKIGGCILAHSMGLGKSLATIALLRTLMYLPDAKIRKVILVVPVNTVANWESQFNQWQGPLKQQIEPRNPGDQHTKSGRDKIIAQWDRRGGVLLMSSHQFPKIVNDEKTGGFVTSADAIFMDESHTMLKQTSNVIFKALAKIKTKRRVCLTGTPFQNSLTEYYRMLSYIRPGLFEMSEKSFEKNWAEPIRAGMATDAAPSIRNFADEHIKDFARIVAPYVHRRDATVLLEDLPSLQQAVLHVRPTSAQKNLFQLYGMHQRRMGKKNFFEKFSALRPIHNHPGTLRFKQPERESRKKKAAAKAASKAIQKSPPQNAIKAENAVGRDSPDSIIDLLSEDEDMGKEFEQSALADAGHWASPFLRKHTDEQLKDPSFGNKCILVLHLLLQAQVIGDKTLLFSQSLPTLDYIQDLLAKEDWTALVPSLKEAFPNKKIGGWKEGIDYVRIDGSISGGDRGDRIKDFDGDDGIKLFLISVSAGSLGINLYAANRVILMDSHFNPTVDLQAIYRAYRYGQTKPVFCYRFLTQGSMEEKVYSRAVTKSALAGSVVDQKAFLRCFNQAEIDSLNQTDDWVNCDRCGRWRMLPPNREDIDMDKLTKAAWYCEMMNQYDSRKQWKCQIQEKDSVWYREHYRKPDRPMNEKKASASQIIDSVVGRMSDEKTKKLVAKDVILQNLLTVSANDKEIVTKHYFHDALLADKGLSIKTEDDAEKDSKPSAGSRNNTPRKKPKLGVGTSFQI